MCYHHVYLCFADDWEVMTIHQFKLETHIVSDFKLLMENTKLLGLTKWEFSAMFHKSLISLYFWINLKQPQCYHISKF